ncbi:MAG: 3-phosphoshikimate 1-carboxyvinyltransferase, partial [Halobacteriaceae archaeon]
MRVQLTPSTLAGQVQAPPSKSYTHRAFLAGGLGNETTIHSPLISADTRATLRVIDAFGAAVDHDDNQVHISGFTGEPQTPNDIIDCANSGTTLRLATATAGLVDGMTVLTGDDSLRQRPQGPLLDALTQLGATAKSTRGNGQAPLVISGPLTGGSVEIPGNISSQFISALLFAGSQTNEGIGINLTTELKSAPYVDITIDVLSDFGVSADSTTNGFQVAGNQIFAATDDEYSVPADFSSASYLLAAGAIAAQDGIRVTGVYPNPQGDTRIVEILRDMGADISWNRSAGEITVQKTPLSGITVSVADTPDLLPTIAVLGAVADGKTRITDCEHVRYKETDRVKVMANCLSEMGADIQTTQETFIIDVDRSTLTGGEFTDHHDHRIIMALTLAGLVATDPITIGDAEHVEVSFP